MKQVDTRLVQSFYGAIRSTLYRRGLYRRLKDGGEHEVQFVGYLPLPDLGAVTFVVDVGRLPATVRLEQLDDPRVIHQISTALGGRRVVKTNTRGLAYTVGIHTPDVPGRLPRFARIDPETRPRESYSIPIGEGRGGPVWRPLPATGHILVGGESGSGKSSWLNAMLWSLLSAHGPDELRVALIDPKSVEFSVYRGIPHLLGDVATGVEEAAALLERLLGEMENREALFSAVYARDLGEYNAEAGEPLPLILVVVDEVTDIALQAGLSSPFYRALIRLASKGRALGLYLVLATQNPKAEVLNTLVRGNMNTRIAFRVGTNQHSRTILGIGGAETLPQSVKGRCLARLGGEPERLQGYYVGREEVLALAARLRGCSAGTPSLLNDAERGLVRWAVEKNEGYVTLADMQEMLGISYWQARRLADSWERRGWLEKDVTAKNKRKVTENLLQFAEIPPGPKNAANTQTPQTAANSPSGPQTDRKLPQTDEGGEL